jgi:hypothetical protein
MVSIEGHCITFRENLQQSYGKSSQPSSLARRVVYCLEHHRASVTKAVPLLFVIYCGADGRDRQPFLIWIIQCRHAKQTLEADSPK